MTVFAVHEAPKQAVEISADARMRVDHALAFEPIETVTGLDSDRNFPVKRLAAEKGQEECPFDLLDRDGGGEGVADERGRHDRFSWNGYYLYLFAGRARNDASGNRISSPHFLEGCPELPDPPLQCRMRDLEFPGYIGLTIVKEPSCQIAKVRRQTTADPGDIVP